MSIFPKLVFLKEKGVGLRLYTDYMISKNGYDWFQWVLICYSFKMTFFWKNDIERRTLWFLWFRRIWSVKRTCILNCTYIWSKCIHSWGIRTCVLSFDSISTTDLSCKTIDELCRKWPLRSNILWIFCELFDMIIWRYLNDW